MADKKAPRLWLWCIVFIVIPIVAMGILRDMTIEDLVHGSDWIATGRIQQIESRWNESRDYIYTYITLSVDEFWKNPLDEDDLTIQIPGGIVDDIMQQVSDTPVFSKGETVILFLFDRDGKKWIYGWEKGKYTVRDGQVQELGISLTEFKNQVINLQLREVDDE